MSQNQAYHQVNWRRCTVTPTKIESLQQHFKRQGMLRAEMARHSVTYAQLAERLSEHGVEDNERNLRNKVARGKFTAGFFLLCLHALGSSHLYLD